MAPRAQGRSPLGRVGRVLVWAVLGPMLAGAVMVAAAVLYARTDGGRERVRRLAVEKARAVVPGLDLGRVEGDYLRELRLVDVTIRDRQGRAAVHADVIDVRFDLAALLHRTVAIEELRIDGARVLAQPAPDGRLNLAELTAPEPAAPPPKAPAKAGDPWHLRIDRLALQGTAEVRLGDGADAGPHFDVRDARLMASLAADGGEIRARVDRLSLDLADAGQLSLEGTAAAAPGPEGPLALLSYALAVEATALDPSAAGLGPAARLGFALSASGHGVPLAPGAHAEATLVVSPGEVAGVPIAGARLAATTDDARWTLARSTMSAAGLAVVASAHGEGRRVDATADVTLAGKLAAGAAGPDVRGDAAVALHVSGAFPALVADVRGDVRALHLGQGRSQTLGVGSATLTAHIAGPADAPHGSLRVGARAVTLPSGAPRIDSAKLEVALERGELAVDAAVAGPRVKGGLRARGTATATGIDVAIAAANADFATSRYRQVLRLLRPTRVRYEAGRSLRLDDTSVHGEGYLFTGDAVVSATLRPGPRGVATPRGDLALTLRRASFEAQPSLDADLHLHVADHDALVKLAAALPGGGTQLTVDASVPFVEPRRGPPRLARRGPVTIHVDARSVRLEELPLVREALARQGVTGGVAHLTLDVTGDAAQPDAKGRFDLHDVTYRNIHGLGRDSTLKTVRGLGGSLTLDTSGDATRAAVVLSVRDAGVLKADARLALGPAALLAGADARRAELRATVDVPTFELARLADFVDELQGVAGQLTAHAEITGSVARPSGSLDVKIANGKASAVAFNQLTLHASGDAGHLQGNVDVVEAIGGTLHGNARLDRTAHDRIEARLEARHLDLGFLRVFVPTLRETAGVAELSARASGNLAAPEVHASLDIDKGRLGIIGQPTFRDIRARATLAPGRLTLERLEMRSGDGTLTGKGWVTLEGLQPRQAMFEAHAHRFLVAAAGSTGARLDGDLAVEAARRADVLDGSVRLPRAEVWLPKTPTGTGGRDLQKIGAHEDVHFVDATARLADERQRRLASAAAKGAARHPVDVDVQVKTGPIYIRSKDLDLELVSTLKVGRVPAGARAGQMTLSGGIHLSRGHINIQGQRFDFDPGDITFDGGPDLNPALYIRLERQYPDARIVVALEGTPRKPILHMTSEPSIYDQAQIVSLILTGQAGGQPSSGKSFDPTAAVATAVLGRLADEIAPEVGLDVLRVENVKETDKEGDDTGSTDTRVEVGKYISDRVYLSYAHVFAAPEGANQNEAHVEYRLTRRWMVQSIFGDAGVGGVDALWTYRY